MLKAYELANQLKSNHHIGLLLLIQKACKQQTVLVIQPTNITLIYSSQDTNMAPLNDIQRKNH